MFSLGSAWMGDPGSLQWCNDMVDSGLLHIVYSDMEDSEYSHFHIHDFVVNHVFCNRKINYLRIYYRF